MDSYKIRKLEATEFHLLIPIMKDCFGVNVDVAFFDWKFLQNPAGSFVGFVAVAEDGEIAAYYGVIPELYKINGAEKVIYQSCDTMTHSRHRRKGLFQKLALECYEYLRSQGKLFVIGFGGGQSTPGFLKFGWRHIFDIRYYFIPKFIVTLSTRKSSPQVTGIAELGIIHNIVLKSNLGNEIHSHKTPDVFKWRISNPSHQYHVIGYQSSGDYTSYACYYITDGKLVLFDFYFANTKEGKTLVNELKIQVIDQNLRGIVAMCQEGSIYSKHLKQVGFFSNPFSKGPLSTRVPFIFFAAKEEMDKNQNPSQWSVNSFDHDSM